MARRPGKSPVPVRTGCEDCLLRKLCPGDSDLGKVERLAGAIVQRRREFERGAMLYRAGDQFRTVYVVHAGAVKGFDRDAEGHQRVTAFFLPGEMLGLDGFHAGSYVCNTQAMTNTTVCELDLQRIEQHDDSQWEFVRVMSKVVSDQKRRLMIGRMKPEERVREVLDDLCLRMSVKPEDVKTTELPLWRDELASYAGVGVDTVDRVLGEAGP